MNILPHRLEIDAVINDLISYQIFSVLPVSALENQIVIKIR